MIVRIKQITLTKRGFVVEYTTTTPQDVRAVTLRPDAMPPGSNLLRTDAVVDLRFAAEGRVSSVSCPDRLVMRVDAVRMA